MQGSTYFSNEWYHNRFSISESDYYLGKIGNDIYNLNGTIIGYDTIGTQPRQHVKESWSIYRNRCYLLKNNNYTTDRFASLVESNILDYLPSDIKNDSKTGQERLIGLSSVFKYVNKTWGKVSKTE